METLVGVISRLNELQGDLLLLPGLMTHISGDVNFPAQCVISADTSPPGMMENCLFPFGSSGAWRTAEEALWHNLRMEWDEEIW